MGSVAAASNYNNTCCDFKSSSNPTSWPTAPVNATTISCDSASYGTAASLAGGAVGIPPGPGLPHPPGSGSGHHASQAFQQQHAADNLYYSAAAASANYYGNNNLLLLAADEDAAKWASAA